MRGRRGRRCLKALQLSSRLEVKVGRQRLLLFITRVAQEHQLVVVAPRGRVEGPVGGDRLVLTLEDGPQVPELSLDVFH